MLVVAKFWLSNSILLNIGVLEMIVGSIDSSQNHYI